MKKYILFAFILISVLNVGAQTGKVSSSDSLKFELAKKQLNTFFIALNAAGLNDVFNGAASTILAPDDQAFAKLPAGTLDSLLKPANKIALINLINDHIIPGKFNAKDIAILIHKNNGQTILTTLSGTKLAATINVNRNIVLIDESGNESIVKQFDILQGNSIIFIISSVILPKK